MVVFTFFTTFAFCPKKEKYFHFEYAKSQTDYLDQIDFQLINEVKLK